MEQADFLCYRLLEGWGRLAGAAGWSQWAGRPRWEWGLGPGHSHEREEQAWDGASFLIESGVPGLQDSPRAHANRQLL